MKTNIQNHISQTELKEALSEYFKNYNIKINRNLIYINSSDVNFYLSISGKEIKLGRVADFGDFILFFILIFGWLIIAARNDLSKNAKAIEIINFVNNKYNNQNTSTENHIQIPIICPICKNPNTKKIRLCEWCGNQII